MSGPSKVIVLDPDPQAGRQIQLGLSRESVPTHVAAVPSEPAQLADLASEVPGLVLIGGVDGQAVALVRRARELVGPEVPILSTARGAARADLEAAGADEVVARPSYLRDLVTLCRILRGVPAGKRDHLVGSLVETTGVYTLVRALSSLGRSAVLTLIRGLRRGEVRFYRGEVTSAEVGLIHGQAALHQLLLWTDARFDFAHQDIVRRQQIPLTPDELFDDAERFLEGVREHAGALSPATILEQDIPRIQFLGMQVPTEVHGVLRMFDGHRVLADILEDSPYRVFETLRVAQKALEVGLLKPVDTQRPKATWRAVLAIDEWLVGDTREAVVERTAQLDSGPVSTAKRKGKGKSRKRAKPATPPAGIRAEIDWGALVPRTIGAEVGPLAGVVPSQAAAGEVTIATRDRQREKLEALMDTDKRDRIFPTEIGLEPKVVIADDAAPTPEVVVSSEAETVSGKKKKKRKTDKSGRVSKVTPPPGALDEAAAHAKAASAKAEADARANADADARANADAAASAKADADARANADAAARANADAAARAKAEADASEQRAKEIAEQNAREAEAEAREAQAKAQEAEAKAKEAAALAEKIAREAEAKVREAEAKAREAAEAAEQQARVAASVERMRLDRIAREEAEAKARDEAARVAAAEEARTYAARVTAAAEAKRDEAERIAREKAIAEAEAAAREEAERETAEAAARAKAESDARDAAPRAKAESDARDAAPRAKAESDARETAAQVNTDREVREQAGAAARENADVAPLDRTDARELVRGLVTEALPPPTTGPIVPEPSILTSPPVEPASASASTPTNIPDTRPVTASTDDDAATTAFVRPEIEPDSGGAPDGPVAPVATAPTVPLEVPSAPIAPAPTAPTVPVATAAAVDDPIRAHIALPLNIIEAGHTRVAVADLVTVTTTDNTARVTSVPKVLISEEPEVAQVASTTPAMTASSNSTSRAAAPSGASANTESSTATSSAAAPSTASANTESSNSTSGAASSSAPANVAPASSASSSAAPSTVSTNAEPSSSTSGAASSANTESSHSTSGAVSSGAVSSGAVSSGASSDVAPSSSASSSAAPSTATLQSTASSNGTSASTGASHSTSSAAPTSATSEGTASAALGAATEKPKRPSSISDATPEETDDEPSDGVVRAMIATADTARARLNARRARPPTPEHDGPAVKEATGEIRERTPKNELPLRRSEPSILVADLVNPQTVAEVAAASTASDLAAARKAIAAVVDKPAAAPATDAASPTREAEVGEVRKDAVAFSDAEEAFFNRAESGTNMVPKFESFDDLDEDYQPVGFWDRVFGRTKPKKK